MTGPYREPAPKKESPYYVDFTVKMASGETHEFSFENVSKGNVAHVIRIQLGKFTDIRDSFGTGNSQTTLCYHRTNTVDSVVVVDKNFNGIVIKLAQVESIKYVVVEEEKERDYHEKTKTPRKFREIIADGLR